MKKILFSKHISWQEVPQENFLYVYNIRTHRYYSFSDTELFIWELIAKQGKIFLYQIIEQCAEYYCIARDDISVDITEFINDLLNIGLIEYEQ